MKLYIFLLMLLILPSVVAEVDSSLVKTKLEITFDKNSETEAILTIKGENLDWSKTIEYNKSIKNNESGEVYGITNTWTQEIEHVMIREFGNSTDVQFTILECNEMANFSHNWVECMNEKQDMINRSEHDEMIMNLTMLKDNAEDGLHSCEVGKGSEISKLSNDLEDNKTWRQRWMVLALGCGGGVLYLLNRYRGLWQRKHQEESEHSIDTTV